MKQVLMFFLLLQSVIFAQKIAFSKDSVLIISNFSENYIGSPEFYFSDTLWIFNIGDSVLQVDSVKTFKTYLYKLKIEFSDSTNYYTIHNEKHYSEKKIKFVLSPNDSAKLIFADPDLCPICKLNSNMDSFTDTLFFFSNSKQHPKYDMFVSGEGTSDISETNHSVQNFYLNQNYPNPFNPHTTIGYQIPKKSFVNISVYNVLGQKIIVLVNQKQNAGFHNVNFDASNLPSGIYFYKLECEGFSQTNKMLLLK